MRNSLTIRLLLVAIFIFALAACRPVEAPRFSIGEDGFAEARINGKSVDDPQSVFRAPMRPLQTMRSSATHALYVGDDSITYSGNAGILRWVFLDIYDDDSFHFARISVGLKDFSPGSKEIYKERYNNRYGFQDYTSYISFEYGGDIFRGYAAFDDTKPYKVVIDKYDPVEEMIEGHLDIHYKLTWIDQETGLDSASISRIHLSEAKFKAKIRKRNINGWLDEQQ